MNYKLFPIFVNFSMAMASLDTRGVGKGYPHLLAFLKVKLKRGYLYSSWKILGTFGLFVLLFGTFGTNQCL